MKFRLMGVILNKRAVVGCMLTSGNKNYFVTKQ